MPPEARWLVFPDNKSTQERKKLFLFFGGGRLLAARDNKLCLCFLGLDVRRVNFYITRITTLLVVHREPGVGPPAGEAIHLSATLSVPETCTCGFRVSQEESEVDRAAQSTKAVHE